MPEEAKTSVKSAASVDLSAGREGGPMAPGGTGAGAATGVEGMLFGAIPFIDC